MSERLTAEQRAEMIALRGRVSSSQVAKQFGVTLGVVQGIWHRALCRGDAEPLATRYGIPGAPIIPNRVPGRIRKAPGRHGTLVEVGRPCA